MNHADEVNQLESELLTEISTSIYARAIAGDVDALMIVIRAGVGIAPMGNNEWNIVKDHVTIHVTPATEQQFSHPMIAADDGSVADAKADDARKATPQGAARETIDNLRHHPEVLGPKLIDDLHDAAKRAFSDKAITGRKW